MIKLFRCERMSANITREQCDKNRFGVSSAPHRRAVAPRWACEDCPGLGVDGVEIPVKESVMPRQCKEPGCKKQAVKEGYCWACCKKHGIDPKTVKPVAANKEPLATVATPSPVSPPAAEAAKEEPPDPSNSDPRETYVCRQCAIAVAANEVDLPNCPMCGKQLHTNEDPCGERVASHAEQPGSDCCETCGTYPCSCDDEVGGTAMQVRDILPDGAFEVEPKASEQTRLGLVTNMDGEQVELGVNDLILAAIDEALADLRTSMLADLSGLAPGRMVCETYRQLERIQTLRG